MKVLKVMFFLVLLPIVVEAAEKYDQKVINVDDPDAVALMVKSNIKQEYCIAILYLEKNRQDMIGTDGSAGTRVEVKADVLFKGNEPIKAHDRICLYPRTSETCVILLNCKTGNWIPYSASSEKIIRAMINDGELKK
jgi:hypothetical protein